MRSPIDLPAGTQELPEARTPHGQTFALPDGRRRLVTRLRPSFEPLRAAAGPWDFTATGGEVPTEGLPYRLTLLTGGIGCTYESALTGGEVRMELIRAGDARPRVPEPRLEGDRIWWENIAEDLDVCLLLRPAGVSLLRILRSERAPRTFRFRIERKGSGLNLNLLPWGIDNADETADRPPGHVHRKLEITATVGEPMMLRDGWERRTATDAWTGRAALRDPETRIAAWTEEVAYPVQIDPSVSETIVAESDDGYEFMSDNTWHNGGNFLYAGQGVPSYGAAVHGGVRFQGVDIPQGATISAATLTIVIPSGYVAGSPDIKVVGDDVDDAPTWGSTSRPSQITETSANTIVTSFTAGQSKVIDVATIIQEIVNRAGWASGNDLRLALKNNKAPSATGWIGAWDYNAANTNEAVLDVTYSAVSGQTLTASAVTSALAVVAASLLPGGVLLAATVVAGSAATMTAGLMGGPVTLPAAAVAASGAVTGASFLPGGAGLIATAAAAVSTIPDAFLTAAGTTLLIAVAMPGSTGMGVATMNAGPVLLVAVAVAGSGVMVGAVLFAAVPQTMGGIPVGAPGTVRAGITRSRGWPRARLLHGGSPRARMRVF